MFYRKFNLIFQDVILIGAGGTGSRVVGPLIQTLKQAQTQINPCLYIVDGDVFENNNLTRQNCIKRDLGRNKAVVMAERYGAALDFPVVAHPHMVNSDGNMLDEISESASDQDMRRLLTTRKLIIMCVDSVEARLDILAQSGPTDIIIDAGNEDTFGQVSIYDKISMPHVFRDSGPEHAVADIKPFKGEFELPFIPAPITSMIHAMENPSEATGSCAMLDQSLAINNLMAGGIINFVQNLAYNNPFYCRTNYFDLIKGNSSERMTPVWMNQAINETLWYEPTSGDREVQWTNDCVSALIGSGAYMYRNAVVGGFLEALDRNVEYIDPALLAALGK